MPGIKRNPSVFGSSRRAAFLLALILLGGVIFTALQVGTLADIVDLVGRARPSLMLAAIVAQVVAFLSLAALWSIALSKLGASASIPSLFVLSLGKLNRAGIAGGSNS